MRQWHPASKLRAFLTAVLFCLYSSGAFAAGKIVRLQDPASVTQYLELSPGSSALVIFQLEGLLVKPHNPIYDPQTCHLFRQAYGRLLQGFSPEQHDIVQTYGWLASPAEATDPQWVELVKALQSKSIAVMGVSTLLAGMLDRVAQAGPAYQFLVSLSEYDFGWTQPLGHTIRFDAQDGYQRYVGAYPYYHKGILVTNGQGKPAFVAHLLVTFLNRHIQQPYSTVYFVSTSLAQLEALQQALHRAAPTQEFVGIHVPLMPIDQQQLSEEMFLNYWKPLAQEALIHQISSDQDVTIRN